MRIEIHSASNFLTNLLRLKFDSNATDRLELFSTALEQLLEVHYLEHWFPESPYKGSGYRCIRINHKMDPILSRAGAQVGFDEEGLRELFPRELTLWIDPQEVSYRIGENGSICVLYDATSPRTPSTPRDVARRRRTTSSDDDSSSSCSPMSTSSSPISVSCSPSSDSCFLMDPRNIELELSHFVDS